MNTCQFMGFPIDNYTIRLVDMLCYVEQFTILDTAFLSFLKPATQREKIYRSSAYMKWLIKVSA